MTTEIQQHHECKLEHWDLSVKGSLFQSWDKASFGAFCCTKLVPVGTLIQVGCEVFEIEKDMGFYEHDALRLVPKDAARRFSPRSVDYAIASSKDAAEAPPRLHRAEQVWTTACRKAGMRDVPALEVPEGSVPPEILKPGTNIVLKVIGLDPRVELAAVEARFEKFRPVLEERMASASGAIAEMIGRAIDSEKERILHLKHVVAFGGAGKVFAPKAVKAGAAVASAAPSVRMSPRGEAAPMPAPAEPAPVSTSDGRDDDPEEQVEVLGYAVAGERHLAFEQASDDYKKATAYEFIKFLREMSSALDVTSTSVSMELAWEDNVPELMRRVGDGEIPPPRVAYDGPNAALIFPAGALRREVVGLSFSGRDGKRVSFHLFGAPAQPLAINAAPGQVIPRV